MKLASKIDQLHKMDMQSLLANAHLLKRLPDSVGIWVLAVTGDYRLIFKRVGPDAIELIDLVAHEDMDKFSRARL